LISKDLVLISKESIWPSIKYAREMSIFIDEGRIWLDAAASTRECKVDEVGNIIDKDGRAVTDGHRDYEWIISKAKQQAVVESSFGRDLLE